MNPTDHPAPTPRTDSWNIARIVAAHDCNHGQIPDASILIAQLEAFHLAALAAKDAEIARLGQNLAAIETAGGDEGASARMAMQAVEDRSRAEKAEQHARELTARVARLERQLAEAGEDKARLDWLETCPLVAGLYSPFRVVTSNFNANGKNIRAAIDAARDRKEGV